MSNFVRFKDTFEKMIKKYHATPIKSERTLTYEMEYSSTTKMHLGVLLGDNRKPEYYALHILFSKVPQGRPYFDTISPWLNDQNLTEVITIAAIKNEGALVRTMNCKYTNFEFITIGDNNIVIPEFGNEGKLYADKKECEGTVSIDEIIAAIETYDKLKFFNHFGLKNQKRPSQR